MTFLCSSDLTHSSSEGTPPSETSGSKASDGRESRCTSCRGGARSISAVPRMLEIRRHLERWRPQIVHVHENHDPRLLALTRGYPTVLTVHDPLGHPGAPDLSRGENWAFRSWFRRAERFVVHGRALVEELEPLIGRRPIAVIPHGVSVRSEPLSPPDSPTVLLFGRLEKYKGVEVLAEAMHQVWSERPDVRLVVAGAGPAAALVPEDARVSLLDRYIPEQDVETLLAQASLVVLPYTQASQSGVGMLAIGAGVPVVVSDLGALPELVCDPSFVVKAGNANALAAAIVQHVEDGQSTRRDRPRTRTLELLVGACRSLDHGAVFRIDRCAALVTISIAIVPGEATSDIRGFSMRSRRPIRSSSSAWRMTALPSKWGLWSCSRAAAHRNV